MKLTQLAGVQRGFVSRTLTEADLLNGWTLGIAERFTLSRTDNTVRLMIPDARLRASAKTSDNFIEIPYGFRPANSGNYGILGSLWQGHAQHRLSRDRTFLSCPATGYVGGIATWETVDPFPEVSPPPRFLECFWRRLRAWWGGRSETHTDYTPVDTGHIGTRVSRPGGVLGRWEVGDSQVHQLRQNQRSFPGRFQTGRVSAGNNPCGIPQGRDNFGGIQPQHAGEGMGRRQHHQCHAGPHHDRSVDRYDVHRSSHLHDELAIGGAL